ncbi:hypothetical protein [Streptomyces sp. NPDC004658]|uniref:hypothetical protein n=1 Tax=Streptomyces sp. NPDC004658 TaxID=3154672 RepID=UPI0033B299BE
MTSPKASDDVTYAGTSTSRDAADQMQQVSSGLYDLAGVKGKASDGGPGVQECGGLPKHGWKIVQYGPDTSRNKNLVLIADNDEQKAGVHITRMKKRNPPKLSLMVISGCYQVPDGQEVEHF